MKSFQETTTEQKSPSVRELLSAALPPILYRNHPKFKEWTGLCSRTVANRDCKGTGPRERIRLGRIVGYPKAALLDWLEEQAMPMGRKES
jgi:hypothetical protein